MLDALEFTGKAYALDPDAILTQIEEKVGYPVIVKPVNLGSSVGISKAKDRASLRDAMDLGRLLFPPGSWWNGRWNICGKSTGAVLGDYESARPSACEERPAPMKSSVTETNISPAARQGGRG